MKYTIYTDGACKGNPGPGGWAMQVHNGSEVILTKSGGMKKTTNNEMELLAIFEALDWSIANLFFKQVGEVEIVSDSSYSINCITKWGPNWLKYGIKDKANYGLIMRCIDIVNDLRNMWHVELKFTHVNGHVGIPGNESVDKLASDKALYYKNLI